MWRWASEASTCESFAAKKCGLKATTLLITERHNMDVML
jgi:hypothetical protein